MWLLNSSLEISGWLAPIPLLVLGTEGDLGREQSQASRHTRIYGRRGVSKGRSAVIKEVLRIDPFRAKSLPPYCSQGVPFEWTDFYGENSDVFNPERLRLIEERSKSKSIYSFTWCYGAKNLPWEEHCADGGAQGDCQLFLHFTPNLSISSNTESP
ncbi:hypothetical protein L211DRAFT_894725 [Terfezia boudieri ATCC MYA-4762]|uniref:Uncharacterized protein n=1 Tax=Terfezia boudieri ATCC MYA-4762 TaxID=1051890 RepID=A0A3N4MF10_9PEZI|nr:hypothetical protein L211DRAFT_894725 [Terfezia boudieri ATCC MYA-4762]